MALIEKTQMYNVGAYKMYGGISVGKVTNKEIKNWHKWLHKRGRTIEQPTLTESFVESGEKRWERFKRAYNAATDERGQRHTLKMMTKMARRVGVDV